MKFNEIMLENWGSAYLAEIIYGLNIIRKYVLVLLSLSLQPLLMSLDIFVPSWLQCGQVA
jgi:hypothetical protein